MVKPIPPTGHTGIGRKEDPVLTVLQDVRRQAARAARLAALHDPDNPPPPPAEPRYLEPPRSFGAADQLQQLQNLAHARSRKQNRLHVSQDRLAVSTADKYRAVLTRREDLAEDCRRLQQQAVDRKARLAQQATDRLQEKMWSNSRDRTAKEKEKKRHILDLERAGERKARELSQSGYARQEQVEHNQLQRWEDWHDSKTACWNTGLTAEEKDTIICAPWAQRAQSTHGSCTAAIDDAQRTMQRNNELLASTIGRWVGKDFVRPYSPLVWQKSTNKTQAVSDTSTHMDPSRDVLTDSKAADSTTHPVGELGPLRFARSANYFRRKTSVTGQLAERQRAQEARLAAQRADRANALEARAQVNKERRLQNLERANHRVEEQMATLIDAVAQREARGTKQLKAVKKLVQQKVREAIEQRNIRDWEVKANLLALKSLRDLTIKAEAHKREIKACNERALARRSTSIQIDDDHSSKRRLRGLGRAKTDPAGIRIDERRALETDGSWDILLDGSPGMRRKERTCKLGDSARSKSRKKACPTASPRTTKVLEGLGLKPGFWSMLETACGDFLAPQLDVKTDTFDLTQPPEDLMSPREPASPSLRAPSSQPSPTNDQAFLTEAAMSPKASGESWSPKASSPQGQRKSAQFSSVPSILPPPSTGPSEDSEAVSEGAEEEPTEDELIKEFDQQLNLYFECMRKEWAMAEEAGLGERHRGVAM